MPNSSTSSSGDTSPENDTNLASFSIAPMISSRLRRAEAECANTIPRELVSDLKKVELALGSGVKGSETTRDGEGEKEEWEGVAEPLTSSPLCLSPVLRELLHGTFTSVHISENSTRSRVTRKRPRNGDVIQEGGHDEEEEDGQKVWWRLGNSLFHQLVWQVVGHILAAQQAQEEEKRKLMVRKGEEAEKAVGQRNEEYGGKAREPEGTVVLPTYVTASGDDEEEGSKKGRVKRKRTEGVPATSCPPLFFTFSTAPPGASSSSSSSSLFSSCRGRVLEYLQWVPQFLLTHWECSYAAAMRAARRQMRAARKVERRRRQQLQHITVDHIEAEQERATSLTATATAPSTWHSNVCRPASSGVTPVACSSVAGVSAFLPGGPNGGPEMSGNFSPSSSSAFSYPLVPKPLTPVLRYGWRGDEDPLVVARTSPCSAASFSSPSMVGKNYLSVAAAGGSGTNSSLSGMLSSLAGGAPRDLEEEGEDASAAPPVLPATTSPPAQAPGDGSSLASTFCSPEVAEKNWTDIASQWGHAVLHEILQRKIKVKKRSKTKTTTGEKNQRCSDGDATNEKSVDKTVLDIEDLFHLEMVVEEGVIDSLEATLLKNLYLRHHMLFNIISAMTGTMEEREMEKRRRGRPPRESGPPRLPVSAMLYRELLLLSASPCHCGTGAETPTPSNNSQREQPDRSTGKEEPQTEDRPLIEQKPVKKKLGRPRKAGRPVHSSSSPTSPPPSLLSTPSPSSSHTSSSSLPSSFTSFSSSDLNLLYSSNLMTVDGVRERLQHFILEYEVLQTSLGSPVVAVPYYVYHPFTFCTTSKQSECNEERRRQGEEEETEGGGRLPLDRIASIMLPSASRPAAPPSHQLYTSSDIPPHHLSEKGNDTDNVLPHGKMVYNQEGKEENVDYCFAPPSLPVLCAILSSRTVQKVLYLLLSRYILSQVTHQVLLSTVLSFSLHAHPSFLPFPPSSSPYGPGTSTASDDGSPSEEAKSSLLEKEKEENACLLHILTHQGKVKGLEGAVDMVGVESQEGKWISAAACVAWSSLRRSAPYVAGATQASRRTPVLHPSLPLSVSTLTSSLQQEVHRSGSRNIFSLPSFYASPQWSFEELHNTLQSTLRRRKSTIAASVALSPCSSSSAHSLFSSPPYYPRVPSLYEVRVPLPSPAVPDGTRRERVAGEERAESLLEVPFSWKASVTIQGSEEEDMPEGRENHPPTSLPAIASPPFSFVRVEADGVGVQVRPQRGAGAGEGKAVGFPAARYISGISGLEEVERAVALAVQCTRSLRCTTMPSPEVRPGNDNTRKRSPAAEQQRSIPGYHENRCDAEKGDEGDEKVVRLEVLHRLARAKLFAFCVLLSSTVTVETTISQRRRPWQMRSSGHDDAIASMMSVDGSITADMGHATLSAVGKRRKREVVEWLKLKPSHFEMKDNHSISPVGVPLHRDTAGNHSPIPAETQGVQPGISSRSSSSYVLLLSDNAQVEEVRCRFSDVLPLPPASPTEALLHCTSGQTNVDRTSTASGIPNANRDLECPPVKREDSEEGAMKAKKGGLRLTFLAQRQEQQSATTTHPLAGSSVALHASEASACSTTNSRPDGAEGNDGLLSPLNTTTSSPTSGSAVRLYPLATILGSHASNGSKNRPLSNNSPPAPSNTNNGSVAHMPHDLQGNSTGSTVGTMDVSDDSLAATLRHSVDEEAWQEVGEVLSCVSSTFNSRTLVEEDAWRYHRNRVQVAGVSFIGFEIPATSSSSTSTLLENGTSLDGRFPRRDGGHAPAVELRYPSRSVEEVRRSSTRDTCRDEERVALQGVFVHESGLLYGRGGEAFALEVYEEEDVKEEDCLEVKT